MKQAPETRSSALRSTCVDVAQSDSGFGRDPGGAVSHGDGLGTLCEVTRTREVTRGGQES